MATKKVDLTKRIDLDDFEMALIKINLEYFAWHPTSSASLEHHIAWCIKKIKSRFIVPKGTDRAFAENLLTYLHGDKNNIFSKILKSAK